VTHGDPNPPAPSGDGDESGRPAPGGRRVFTFASDFAAGRAVQNEILDEVRRNGYAGNCFFAINLALEEALTNAIRHGNRLDPNKKVHVEARVTPRRVEITVQDEGPGFDRKNIPDPTAEENLEKCSGRGILLIEAYMSSVKWDRGGRRLRMVKKNEPADGSAKA
jgi:serine/threonine-protein kinase RsbW